MSKVSRFSLVVLTCGALLLSALSGASAEPSASKMPANTITKSVAKIAPAKTKAAKNAAAKKAAAKKAAEQAKQTSRMALFKAIMDSLISDAPKDLPLPDSTENVLDASGSIASMPIMCPVANFDREYVFGNYGPRVGKPTAQLIAFNEAMTIAQNELYAANTLGYQAFDSATKQAQEEYTQAIESIYMDPSGWSNYLQAAEHMRIYLQFLLAVREPQAELNAANTVANQAFIEAKYAALANYDAATFDASTESGASALDAIYAYRKANKNLELEQYAASVIQPSVLSDDVNERMQKYLDILATLDNEDEIDAATNTYYGELSELYVNYSNNVNEYIRPYYEALQAAENAFVALTGDAPSHPDYYPHWWYYGDVYPPMPVDPPVDGENGGSSDDGDKGDVVYCQSLDCPNPDRPTPVDPTVPDKETGTPEIIVCPPAPPEFFEEIPLPEVSICEEAPKEIDPESPTSVESENSDSAGTADSASATDSFLES